MRDGRGDAVGAEGDAMDEPRRLGDAVAALEIDDGVDRLHLAGRAGDDVEQRRAVGGDDVGKRHLARRELGDVVVEPIGERRVHVGDGAVGLGREEPGRRMVEIVDGVLQVLEEGLVAVAVAA